jgi:hypothetical protein
MPAQRLFFGNPAKTTDAKQMPKGERKLFGEAQIEPAKRPILHPRATVLCYGNSPVHPQSDLAFKVVNEKLIWPEKPKD